MVRRKVRAAARLLVLPQHGPIQPLLTTCVHATSLLPSRAQPGSIFLVVDGALHMLDTRAAHPAIAPITTVPANLYFVQLLASSKQPSPTELIAFVEPANTRPGDPPVMWRFRIEGNRATGSPVGNEPWLQSREAFFRQFHVPRCRDDGTDCLVIAESGAFLDIEPRPRAPRHEWKTVEAARIHDAAWNPAGEGSALALVTCDQKAP